MLVRTVAGISQMLDRDFTAGGLPLLAFKDRVDGSQVATFQRQGENIGRVRLGEN